MPRYSDLLNELLVLIQDITCEANTGMFRGVTPRLEEIVSLMDLRSLILEVSKILEEDTINRRRTPLGLLNVLVVCARLNPTLTKKYTIINSVLTQAKNLSTSDKKDVVEPPPTLKRNRRTGENEVQPEVLARMMANLSIPIQQDAPPVPREDSAAAFHDFRQKLTTLSVPLGVCADREMMNPAEEADDNNNDTRMFAMDTSPMASAQLAELYKINEVPRRGRKTRASSPDLEWAKSFKVRKLAHNSDFNMLIHHVADEDFPDAQCYDMQQNEARALPMSVGEDDNCYPDLTGESSSYQIANINTRIKYIQSQRFERPNDYKFTIDELTPNPRIYINQIITCMALDRLDKEGLLKFHKNETLALCYATFSE